MMHKSITNAELATFLRGAAAYFRNRDGRGEDAAFWSNESNAERCEIAAARLSERLTPMMSENGIAALCGGAKAIRRARGK